MHTWPLALHLNDALPGEGLGDNLSTLWSFWWMRQSLASPELSFFHTSHLFAPVGTPLVLHAHVAPAALAGATMLAGTSIPASVNLVLMASVALNGATAYALAYWLTRRRLPAILAGVLFMLAPPLLARMMGHFNLVQAWTLVGAVWLLLRATSNRSALLAGAALALVAWTDYYLFVYALGVIAVLLAARRWSLDLRRSRARPSAVSIGSAVAAALCAAVAVAILTTGGGVTTVWGVRVSMRSPENALMAMWVFAIAAAVAHWHVRLAIARRPIEPAAWPRHLPAALGALAVGIAPLAWMAVDLWMSGGYATQQSSWRTAPHGVDLATLVQGPPFHGLLGPSIRQAYAYAGIDVMESSAWLGLSACVLAVLALGASAIRDAVRPWRAIAIVFFIWSLGPFLIVAGVNTWLILPQAALRYLPLLGNARMPSRALIVVSLALAMVAAVWAAGRSRRAIALAVALACIELAGAPLPVAALAVPRLYQVLAEQPAGAVLELPVGYRDGFGETGDFDDRALLYQTVHGHPIAGGFVARLSPAVRGRYQNDAALNTLVELSDRRRAPHDPPGDAPPCDRAVASLAAAGFRYVVLDRLRMPPPLADYVSDWPLTPLLVSGQRDLYRLDPICTPNRPTSR